MADATPVTRREPFPSAASPRRDRRTFDPDETQALLLEYCRTRDVELRNRVALLYDRFVRHLASRFAPEGGNTMEDLVQVGHIGLLAALDRFDPSAGVRFVTFAGPTIAGVIKHYLRDHGWMVKAPRRLRELAISLPRVRARLEHRLGRVPSLAEMAREAGVTEERLIEAMEFSVVSQPTSLDATHADPNGGTCSLADAVGGLDPELLAVEERETVRRALGRLGERHREVIEHRFFGHGSQADVARTLGISQMHVSRLERQALAALRLALAESHGEARAARARRAQQRRRSRRETPSGALPA